MEQGKWFYSADFSDLGKLIRKIERECLERECKRCGKRGELRKGICLNCYLKWYNKQKKKTRKMINELISYVKDAGGIHENKL